MYVGQIKGPAAAGTRPGPGPQRKDRIVDQRLLAHRAHFSPTDQETPHGCVDGRVYLGFEGKDENGEHVEEIERVLCRSATARADSPGPTSRAPASCEGSPPPCYRDDLSRRTGRLRSRNLGR